MAYLRRKTGFFALGVVAVLIAGGAYMGRGLYHGAVTIHELLNENKQLKQAIGNLTEEDQIGYAKVISQRSENGRTLTTIRFVENLAGRQNRQDPAKGVHGRGRCHPLRCPDRHIR